MSVESLNHAAILETGKTEQSLLVCSRRDRGNYKSRRHRQLLMLRMYVDN